MSGGLLDKMGLQPVDLGKNALANLAKKAAAKGGEYFNPDPQERVDNSPAAIARRKKEMAGAEEWSAAATAQEKHSEWVKGTGGRAEKPASFRKGN